MPAIELTNVTKVYRKYARRKQFATLKSALLKGSLIQDLQPEETFPANREVVPVGAIEVRQPLRSPWRAISSRVSGSRPARLGRSSMAGS